MKTVALKLLKECNKIDYIVGPNQETKGGDLTAAFTAFIRSLRNGDNPCEAAKKAAGATGREYTCHDRQELEIDVNLLMKLDAIESMQNTLYHRQEKIIAKLEIIFPTPPPQK